MVTNRRGAILSIIFTAFGRASFGLARIGRCGGRMASASSVSFDTQVADSAEDRLRKDLDRLAVRVYSEEGIPMLLACENLTRNRTAQPAFVPTDLNRNLSSALLRDTNTFERIKPEASAADIPKIIEMLADRDFSAGGMEKTL